ncbi:MAG: diguanylate cyclase, partial [Planctomycetes bacterium]|nr:diguanylate cyclase [Planctomycetota bacterium]
MDTTVTSPIRMTPEDLPRRELADPLTGLFNRRFVYRHLASAVDWKAPPPVPPFSVLLFDLDEFRKVGQAYGATRADALLAALARRLRESLGVGTLFARLAGDAFVLLLPRTDKAQALLAGNGMRSRVAEAPVALPDGTAVPLTASVGVATFPEDARTPEGLLAAAQLAVAQAKAGGRDRVIDARTIDPAIAAERTLYAAFPCRRLFGRERERSLCRQCAAAGLAGTPQFVLLAGPRGIGKTRLLEEAARHAVEENALTWHATCRADERAVPFAPLAAVLRAWLRAHPAFDPAACGLSPEQVGAMAAVLPEFLPGAAVGPGGTPMSPAAAPLDPRALAARRVPLFEGLLRLITNLSIERPIFLLLDDLEFADPATLEICRRLLKTAGARMVAYAALRTDPADESRPGRALEEFLSWAAENPVCRRLDLAPLDARATTDQVSTLLPGRPPMERIDQVLFSTTQGNPLFVEESVKVLLQRRALYREPNSWSAAGVGLDSFPPTLAAALRARIEALDPETRLLIGRLALLGGAAPLDLLSDLLGHNPGHLLELVERARDLRLLLPEPAGAETQAAFAARAAQEEAYVLESDESRAAVHADIARLLATRYAEDLTPIAHVLARHLAGAGQTEAARTLATRAAEHAETLFAAGQVVHHPPAAGHAGAHGVGPAAGAGHGARRPPRIPEAAAPLAVPAQIALTAALRTLCVAIKNARRYPAGSSIVAGGVAAFTGALDQVFRQIHGFTLSEDAGALAFNRRAADPRIVGSSGKEGVGLLRERSMTSLTIVREIGAGEVEKLIELLARPVDEQCARPGFWEQKLLDAHIDHVGVAQPEFVPTRILPLPEIDPVDLARGGDDRLLSGAREVLRFFNAAVENERMFPPGSTQVNTTVETLAQALERFFETASVLVLTVSGEHLAINGTPASARVFGNNLQDIVRLLLGAQVPGVAFLKGVQVAQLSAFVKALSAPDRQRESDARFWMEWSLKHGITHILVGDQVGALHEEEADAGAAAAAGLAAA